MALRSYRSFFAGVLLFASAIVASPLKGDDALELYSGDAEELSFPAAALESLALSLNPHELPAMEEMTPAFSLSPGERSALFLESLAEDATYRATAGVRSLFDDFSPNAVYDNDWVAVKNPEKQTPARAVCRIFTTLQSWSGKRRVITGTAFFVSPHLLLTNAHMIEPRNSLEEAIRVKVVPAATNGSAPFGVGYAIQAVTTRKWAEGNYGAAHDFALVYLPDRKLYRRVKYYFDIRNLSSEKLKQVDLHMLGYPGGEKSGTMYYDTETKNQVVYAGLFRHFLDTRPGTSGSPMYMRAGKKYYVVGINSKGASDPKKINIAFRLTGAYFKDTKAVIEVTK